MVVAASFGARHIETARGLPPGRPGDEAQAGGEPPNDGPAGGAGRAADPRFDLTALEAAISTTGHD